MDLDHREQFYDLTSKAKEIEEKMGLYPSRKLLHGKKQKKQTNPTVLQPVKVWQVHSRFRQIEENAQSCGMLDVPLFKGG